MRFGIQALLLSLLLFFVSAAAIAPDSTLYASKTNQTWRSPNNTFFLGFVPLQPQTSPPSFIAAIFYSGGAPFIWSAGNSTSVDSGGRFQFLSNGILRLVNGSDVTIWDSGTSNLGVSSATLGDDGNLALSKGSSTVWSTFDHPTDTIVPHQNFTANKILRSGSYSFRLLNTGNLTLSWNSSSSSSIVYWNQGLKSSVYTSFKSPVLSLQSTGILLLDAMAVAYTSDYAEGSDVLRVLRLDSDGNLRIHSTSRGSGNSTPSWAAVQDQCKVFGFCGTNGICSYKDSNYPICGCPSQNFEMIDPNDSRKGCRRKVNLDDCQGSTIMLTLDDTQFLTYPPEDNSVPYYIGTSTCRKNCLVERTCFASTLVSDGSGQCYIKRSDFLSGYQSPTLPSTSFVKVCGPVAPNPPPPSLGETGKGKRCRVPAWVVVGVILGTLLGLIALEGGLWLWCCKNKRRFGTLSAQLTLLEYASGAPIQFSYKELQRSTKGFKEKLGAGGFGVVYRGILDNKTVVAVKQLEGIEQGEKQFKMEVATISSTHHLNLVRLIGFCSEGRHRLLVYEFMKNGSLDNFLFVNEESGKLLNWEYRFNIALGTAKGIMYLNEECRDCIVHCDIKPGNILLDENYIAKVSDFGLAKLINPKDHRHRTLKSVRGTRGYLAPEWLANLPITSKSDVYSYGMVLLEIVSGRRNFEISEETNLKKFSIWAYEEFEKGNIFGILDKRLVDQQVDMEQVHRAIQTSFWCIQEHPSQRPTMGKVLQMLEGITKIERPPALKSVKEGSAAWTSTYLSPSNVSGFPTVADSSPGHFSSSSFTSRTPERTTSALLRSESS